MKKNRHEEQAHDAEQAARRQVELESRLEAGTADQQADGESAGQPASDIVAANETIERLAKSEADCKELSDRYLRLMAEYDNFRRRSQKEREGVYGDSVVAVVKEWLLVVDNLERAEQAALAADGESARKIADGVLLVLKQAGETLSRLGVKEIDCLGQPFDPNLADAVIHVEDESAEPSTVVEILQKGYIRDDRVIRHCMVKVAN